MRAARVFAKHANTRRQTCAHRIGMLGKDAKESGKKLETYHVQGSFAPKTTTVGRELEALHLPPGG